MEKSRIIAALLSNFFSASIVVFKPAFLPFSPLLSYPSPACSHLLVGDRDEALLGQLPQGVDICPHVQLTAHQHHFGVGTKLLRLPLPLLRHEWTEKHSNTSLTLPNMRAELPELTGERLRYSDDLWLSDSGCLSLRENDALAVKDICSAKESKGK